jgi:putative phage-type endonuclease
MGKVIDARDATPEDIAACCDEVREIFSREHIEQRTDEWYAARNKLIGGSESANMCIEPSKKSPFEDKGKIFLRKNGLIEGFKGNQFTAHGQKYEDEACEKYANLCNETVFLFGLVRHPDPEHYYIGGSPDGITASGKLVEIKCPYARKIQEGVVPGYYFPQVQQCMFVLNLKTCDFIQYKPGSTWTTEVLTVTKIDWDPVWWEDHLRRLRSFWTDMELYREKKLLPDYAEEAWRKIKAKPPPSTSSFVKKPPPCDKCKIKFKKDEIKAQSFSRMERKPEYSKPGNIGGCKIKFKKDEIRAQSFSHTERKPEDSKSGSGGGCKIKFNKPNFI